MEGNHVKQAFTCTHTHTHMAVARVQNIELDFYVDIHAHSTLTNGFMYGNIYDDEERFERQADFPKLLAKHAEDFSWVSINTASPLGHEVEDTSQER